MPIPITLLLVIYILGFCWLVEPLCAEWVTSYHTSVAKGIGLREVEGAMSRGEPRLADIGQKHGFASTGTRLHRADNGPGFEQWRVHATLSWVNACADCSHAFSSFICIWAFFPVCFL